MVNLPTMTTLTPQDIQTVAHLARIKVEEKDLPHYVKDLNNIMTVANKMQAIDTGGVQPLSHPQDATQTLRPDEVTETNQRDLMQPLAPDAEHGFYKTPKPQGVEQP